MRKKKTEEKELGHRDYEAVDCAMVVKLFNGKYVVLGKFNVTVECEGSSRFGGRYRYSKLYTSIYKPIYDKGEDHKEYGTSTVYSPNYGMGGHKDLIHRPLRFDRSTYANCWVDTKKEAEGRRRDYLSSLGLVSDCHA